MKKFALAALLLGGIAAPAAIVAGSVAIAPDEPLAGSAQRNVITDAKLQAMHRDVVLVIPAGSVDRVFAK